MKNHLFQQLSLLIVAALVANSSLAQIPDIKESQLENPRYPDWRSLESLLAGTDALAIQYQEDLNVMASESTGECRTLDRGPIYDKVRGEHVRSDLAAAHKAAKYSGVGYVASSKVGIRSDGMLGTLLEIDVQENFSGRAFPKAGRSGENIFYFYPSWDFSFGGQRICAMSNRVPARIPAVGSRIVLFANPDLFDKDSRWLLKEAELFPVIFEDGEGIQVRGLPEAAQLRAQGGLDKTIEDLRLLKSSKGD